MPGFSRSLVRLAWWSALLVATPYPAAAILCEIYAPCVHVGPGRVVFIGTVQKVVEEKRGDWEQPELIAYFRIDEPLSEAPVGFKPTLLSSGFYEVGKSYLIVSVPWRDGVSVEWRGDDYRGFQTALVCGPALPLDWPSTSDYVDHFRKALGQSEPVTHSVSIYDESGEESREVAGALIHLTGESGSYWATADEDGDAEFESIKPGVYRWEVWDGDRRFDPDEDTNREIGIVAGSCSSTDLGLLPRP